MTKDFVFHLLKEKRLHNFVVANSERTAGQSGVNLELLENYQAYPPRSVQGFFKKPELELMIQRRSSRKKLADAVINDDIIERYYQNRAVRRIGETFEVDNQRKALVVMATGAGKTRTVIALADVLMRCNWAKRILFLADRVALVNQAVKAFKSHLPDSSPVNLVTEKHTEGRVFVSTYPTMMGLIDDAFDGQRRFGVGHFDLIIIDEAHRSVYQKYRAIFEYFDSLLVGLTATPKDEIDHNTYGLFDLESGVPTDAYALDDAVSDGYLVPPKAVSVPLKFQREGIKYDDLSDDEQEQWDALEWNEDGTTPDEVDAAALNKWLFNTDTVDKVLAHLMTNGQKVAGGDRSLSFPHTPMYDYTPTGVLTIQVGRWPSKTWKDTPKTQLERRQGEVIAGVVVFAQNTYAKELEEARRKEAHRRTVERFEFLTKRRANEVERFKHLDSSAKDWERAARLRAYADVVEADARSKGDLSPDQLEWLAWARAKADWLDPLIQVSDPILDAPEPKQPGYW